MNNMNKEQIITKIKEIVKDEKFRLDAYFFCGFPSGTPNEKLLHACEAYLDTCEKKKFDKMITENMIEKLEEAAAKAKASTVANIVDNNNDIELILAHKELLY